MVTPELEIVTPEDSLYKRAFDVLLMPYMKCVKCVIMCYHVFNFNYILMWDNM